MGLTLQLGVKRKHNRTSTVLADKQRNKAVGKITKRVHGQDMFEKNVC